MATKDITDKQVLMAYLESKKEPRRCPSEILAGMTGQPEKVCWCAMERTYRRELIEYGVSLRCAWLTEKGLELIASGGDNAL